jgi:hypothetical protein
VRSGGKKREWMLGVLYHATEDGDVVRRNGGGNPFARKLI